jgi:hypothetical protein
VRPERSNGPADEVEQCSKSATEGWRRDHPVTPELPADREETIHRPKFRLVRINGSSVATLWPPKVSFPSDAKSCWTHGRMSGRFAMIDALARDVPT